MGEPLDVRRVVKAIENVAARHGIKKDPPMPYALMRIYGYSTTPDDMDAQIAAEYAALGPEPDSLDAAWAAAEAALPYKRWHVTLSGDWEDGWEAEATSRLAGEGGITVSTNESGWFHEPGGHRTPAAAIRALAVKLREVGR